MNYWIEICKYRVNRWYLRAKNSCDKCNELYLDVNDYVIENRIIFQLKTLVNNIINKYKI